MAESRSDDRISGVYAKNGVCYAIKGGGNTTHVGINDATHVVSGTDRATIFCESGAKYQYHYDTQNLQAI